MSGDASSLDDMIWGSLSGVHAELVLRSEHAACYPEGFPLFAALHGPPAPALDELASLVEAGGLVALAEALPESVEPKWLALTQIQLVQMVCETPVTAPALESSPLSPQDMPQMLALVERTQPGPFGPRSIELGRYIGYRDEQGQLMAMAGERLHPHGCTEVSAVCTHPDHQRKGLGEAAVRDVACGIQARGELPFLHVEAQKEAKKLVPFYERIGFRRRRDITLSILQRSEDR
jgi:ribosomal protein S18 acetylase RimI-like enzyme